MFDDKFDPVKAVLIETTRDCLREISLDISMKTSQVAQYLGGSGTFIGQWVEHDIVIMKCRECIFEPELNNNRLARPFHLEKVSGVILLIRMDVNSHPQDLTLQEVLDLKLVSNQSRYRLRSNSNPEEGSTQSR
jgi:hypothetical protein